VQEQADATTLATAEELAEVVESTDARGNGVTYDDLVAACQQAIREELPVEEMGAGDDEN